MDPEPPPKTKSNTNSHAVASCQADPTQRIIKQGAAGHNAAECKNAATNARARNRMRERNRRHSAPCPAFPTMKKIACTWMKSAVLKQPKHHHADEWSCDTQGDTTCECALGTLTKDEQNIARTWGLKRLVASNARLRRTPRPITWKLRLQVRASTSHMNQTTACAGTIGRAQMIFHL